MCVYTPSLGFDGSWNERLPPQCKLPDGLISARLREPSRTLPVCEIMPENDTIKNACFDLRPKPLHAHTNLRRSGNIGFPRDDKRNAQVKQLICCASA